MKQSNGTRAERRKRADDVRLQVMERLNQAIIDKRLKAELKILLIEFKGEEHLVSQGAAYLGYAYDLAKGQIKKEK